MAIGITCFQTLLWFPAWGGTVFPAKKGATEEDYYYSGVRFYCFMPRHRH